MKHELDFSGREQLYYQIYDYMYQDIVTGKYQIGDLIPAESEMMAYYKVSRATVRKAMDMLADEGLIEKKRGNTATAREWRAKRFWTRRSSVRIRKFWKIFSLKKGQK